MLPFPFPVAARLPRYPLGRVQTLVARNRYLLTGSARRGAGELGFDESDIVDCVAGLLPEQFYKSMQSQRRMGTWQDVYRPSLDGIPLYVKVQIVGMDPTDLTVVISFKRR